jgi:four helix bundle protein
VASQSRLSRVPADGGDMATVRTYRDLIAWQKAMDLACAVYQLTSCFPREEMYGLTRQLRESSVSVASNIAEGQARGSREFRHFLTIALGSVQELETQIVLAQRLEMANEAAGRGALETAAEVGRLLRGLSASLGPKAA